MSPACKYCDEELVDVAYRDERFVVRIMRLQPTGPGYTLLIPVDHVSDLREWSSDRAAELLDAIGSVSRAVEKAFDVTGTTVVTNVGPPGQSVFHLHVHIVPRRPGDGYPSMTDQFIDDDEAARQVESLAEVLRP